MPKTDKEKARNLSYRFKRINLIRNSKDFAIEVQDYELVANLRDIERDFEKGHDPNEEELAFNFIFNKLEKFHKRMIDGKSKNYLSSLLREHKIDQILKNPSN